MKKTIIFIIFFAFSCTNSKLGFSPAGNSLPDAVMGQDYLATVEITNAVLFKENIDINILPKESGLKWKPAVNALKRGGAVERGGGLPPYSNQWKT